MRIREKKKRIHHEIMIAKPNKDPHFSKEERDCHKANALGKEGIFFILFLMHFFFKKSKFYISDTKKFYFHHETVQVMNE